MTKNTILIVDDEPNNLNLLDIYLRTADFEVLTVKDGASALEQAARTQPDLILLDVMMPGLDGFETCRRLKINAATKDIPIIFLSSAVSPADKIKGLKLGAVDYITKPFHPDEVLTYVNTHITVRRLQKQLKMQNIQLQREIAERIQAQKAAEAANIAKSAFLANMSHELRTPLSSILGYTQLFKRDPSLSEKQQAGIAVIHRSSKHLLTMINDLLDLSKIEAGKMDLQPASLNLSAFLDAIIEIIHVRAEEKGLIFTYKAGPALPIAVHVDEIRLRQILLNLLSNAVKFTYEGSVTLHVGVRRQELEAKGPESKPLIPIKFKVEDTGIGIEPEKLDDIFAPFQQAGVHHHNVGGTGLGLAISKRLVEIMGGTLGVESVPGKGSVFWVNLDLPVVEEWSENDTADEHPIIGLKGPKHKLLIVDDDHNSRAMLVIMLTRLGFEVEEAVDGQDALRKAETFRPDMILMDLMMPNMNGFEATQKIKQSSTLKDITVIAVSAKAFRQDQQKSLQAGCDGFVAKPIDLDILLQEIKTHTKLNLEWVYETRRKDKKRRLDPVKGTEATVTQLATVAGPPPKQIAILLDMAERGDIKSIRKQIVELDHLGEPYQPLVNQLRHLANRYQLKGIRKLLKPYVNKK